MAIDLSSSLIDAEPDEDVDPMSSVANLVDVMLVFACGLMMALVLAWNVDISRVQEAVPTDQLGEVDDVTNLDEQLRDSDGTSYVNMGSAWMDPETGKYYIVVEDGDDAASGGSADAGDAGASDAANAGGTAGQ